MQTDIEIKGLEINLKNGDRTEWRQKTTEEFTIEAPDAFPFNVIIENGDITIALFADGSFEGNIKEFQNEVSKFKQGNTHNAIILWLVLAHMKNTTRLARYKLASIITLILLISSVLNLLAMH